MAYPFYQSYPSYNPMYYQQFQNVQQPQQQAVQNNTQIQNGGFVFVKDVNEAMNYPVAPGNSVTFKNESQPYIYTKTLGFSQLDQPMFEVFKLVKEDNKMEIVEPEADLPKVEYMTLEEAENIKAELTKMQSEIDFLRAYIESEDNGGKTE